MQVVIAGGHGKIAMHLTKLLIERGDQVRSLIRNSDHAPEIEALGAKPVVSDLEADDVDTITEAVGSVNAIVFAAGSGPGSGPERKETMDYGGAAKLITAAKRNGISRYVIVSSMGADPDQEGDEGFDVYLRAKGRADAELVDSGLDYTIVRPGSLTDESPTGKVELGATGRGEIPRGDVAAILAATLVARTTVGMTFEAIGGESPIDDAVRGLAG